MKQSILRRLDKNQLVTITGRRHEREDKEGKNKSNSETIEIYAPIPDTFTIGANNEVNETWDWFKIKSKVLQTVAPTVGYNIDRGIAERSFWRAINNTEITLDLSFEAFESGLVDVVTPIKTMFEVFMPQETAFGKKGLSFAAWRAPHMANVRVGKILTLNNVIVKNITANFKNTLDADFHPMSATCSITFIPQDPIGSGGYSNVFQGNYGQ